MTDNISAVLHTISASLNSVQSAFESVYNTAANDASVGGFDTVRAQIEAATESTAALQDQLQGVAGIRWDSQNRIEVFQNTGIERFQNEMISLTDITENFLQRQEQISIQAAGMELLPPNAIDDINATNQRIQELGERMAAMQSMDVSMLDDPAIARLNSEYEGIRGNLNNLINLQDAMNTAMEQNDFSAMNQGFNQLNDAAEAFEKRIRDNTHALQEMANIEWVSVNNIEIFSGNDAERLRSEVDAANEMMWQLTSAQEQISVLAAGMNLLPPNAIDDINATNQRIQELGERMASMQSMDVSLLNDTEIARFNSEYEGMRGNLNNLINLQESMNAAMEQGDFSAMNRGFNQLNDSANAFEKRIRDNAHALQQMANIEWVSTNNIEIFSGNDAERFKIEVESANEMLRQLTFTQEQISVQAANMNLLPPNALDDINGMGDRITALRSQIEDVQKTRIAIIGVEQANSEVENLRWQLQQAIQAQTDMNQALQNMDASGANRAYQQLNNIVNQTGRNIRDNIREQANFNAEIAGGKTNALGLKSILGGIVGVLSVRAGIGFLQQSISLTNENIRLEQQLANVMSNRGATYEEFVRLQQRAAEIQANTNDMINSTTMMGAANELARHVGSVEAIEIMMGSLGCVDNSFAPTNKTGNLYSGKI